MRVALDSNVVISGFLFGGVPSRLLQHAVACTVQCFISLPLLDEICDVLQRPKFGLLPEQALGLVEEIHDLCRIVAPRERVHVIEDDPDDNMVLECAMEAGVSIVVSGDAHLLAGR
jgi:putative PIN family toxin of toxin-antitoxin system